MDCPNFNEYKRGLTHRNQQFKFGFCQQKFGRMLSALTFTSLIVTLIVIGYLYVRNAFSYWKRRGVSYIQPSFPFGNLKNIFLQTNSFADELKKYYNSSDEPVLGLYSSVSPNLLVRDPNIIREILIKDFSSFHQRVFDIDEKVAFICVESKFE